MDLSATSAVNASGTHHQQQNNTPNFFSSSAAPSNNNHQQQQHQQQQPYNFQPGKFHCNYCKQDITNQIYITCAHCPEFDLCLDCHLVGASLPPHDPVKHGYRIVDDHVQPVYSNGWTLNEEWLLLEAIQAKGLGNWEGVRQQMQAKAAEMPGMKPSTTSTGNSSKKKSSGGSSSSNTALSFLQPNGGPGAGGEHDTVIPPNPSAFLLPSPCLINTPKDPRACEFHFWRMYYANEEKGLLERPLYLEAPAPHDHYINQDQHNDDNKAPTAATGDSTATSTAQDSTTTENNNSGTTTQNDSPTTTTKHRSFEETASIILKNQQLVNEERIQIPEAELKPSEQPLPPVKQETMDVDELLVLSGDDEMKDEEEPQPPKPSSPKKESSPSKTSDSKSTTPPLLLLKDPKQVTRNDIQKDDRGILLGLLKERNEEPFHLPFEPPRKKEKENDIGWNPLRRAFAIQHDDAAEHYVGGYDLDSNDIPEKAELKIKMLQTFEHVLQERMRREKFVVERGLQDMNFVNESGYRDSKSKRMQNRDKYELDMHRPFARFIPGEDFETLMNCLKKEKELRKRIKKFKHYRDNGITTLADVDTFEMETRKRRAQHARKSGRGRSNLTSDEPGYDLMTAHEQSLCSKLGLSPSQLLVVKDTLVRESFKLGTLNRKTAAALFRSSIESDKIDRIFDYMVESHFIEEERHLK